MKETKKTASIERIQGKGLKLDLSAFKKLKAFQAGGQYWEHQSQTSIREHMGEFLPLMQVDEDGESVLCQMFVKGKEVASESRPAKSIPNAQRIKLESSIENLKSIAADPDVDTNVKKIIEAFMLPDPIKDPELYRVYGSRWNPKLMVVWGCEKEAGTSIAPEEVSKRVVKESIAGGAFRKLPIILLILILLGALLWFISKIEKVPDNTGPVAADKADADDDGTPDVKDPFPNDPKESVDTDGDGTGNNADTDDDNDGTPDIQDAFPNDPSETVDTDADGVGNNSDTFPNDPKESVDTDGDGTGNNADTDDDNDGTPDIQDAFPNDPSETADTDGDGVGNNADPDALAIEDGPATEEEIEERRVAIRDAIEKGEPIAGPQSSRKATEGEVNLAKLIRPAVVTIVVEKAAGDYLGQGTGFIITEDGILVTNYHVVEKIKSAKAILSDGRVLTIESVLASDKERDLALLKLTPGKYPFLRLAEKGDAEVGDKIAVMGSPEGLRNTYSTGIISAERPGGSKGVDKLQISAPVSPGSSGSPVISQDAMVVGVVHAGITSKHAQALNLAIDVGELHELINQSPEAVAKSVKASSEQGAANKKTAESIPDDAAIANQPEDGGSITWDPSPSQISPTPVAPDSRLQLDELDRQILANGKIQVRLNINIKGEKGELSQLKGIQCSIDNKPVKVVGSILSFTTEKGRHSLRISWLGQSGKKHAINSDINIGVISVK